VGKGEAKANEAPVQRSAGRSSRRWLLWLVLVAGTNFFLGVLVGRGTSPLRFDIQALQKEIAALGEAETRSEIEHFRELMSGTGKDQPLDFYDVLKQDDKPRPAPVSAGDTATKKPPAPEPAPVSAASAEQAAKSAVEARPPKNAKGPSVQVAAMREPEAAQRIVQRLISQGFAARSVRSKTADRGTWYRVRVGPFADRQAANEARDRLSRLNYDAIVVDP
jgi:cell division septation protein DedD